MSFAVDRSPISPQCARKVFTNYSEGMDERLGSDSRCCRPREVPLQRVDFVDKEHEEVQKLYGWLLGLDPWLRDHELGTIAELFETAARGELVPTRGGGTPIKPIWTDPELFELRHRVLTTPVRFYHGEPDRHPDAMVHLHEHIKTGAAHQQEQIDFAVRRYHQTGAIQPPGSTD